MGAYRKFHFRKKFFVSVLIHAVDISTCIHSDHEVVVVELSRVACYGESEVFSLIEGTPVGIYMIHYPNHIYLRWVGLPVSKFIHMGVIIILRGLSELNLVGGSSFLALAHFVKMSNFVTLLALGILCRTLCPGWCSSFPHLMHLPTIPGGFLD